MVVGLFRRREASRMSGLFRIIGGESGEVPPECRGFLGLWEEKCRQNVGAFLGEEKTQLTHHPVSNYDPRDHLPLRRNVSRKRHYIRLIKMSISLDWWLAVITFIFSCSQKESPMFRIRRVGSGYKYNFIHVRGLDPRHKELTISWTPDRRSLDRYQ